MIFIKDALIKYSKCRESDDAATPYTAVYPLIKYLPKEKLTIWECSDDGTSKISEILIKNDYTVISTDIKTGFNFLKDKPLFDFDMIITNPPYSLKNEWLAKCYKYNKPFALLLPITALESEKRNTLYRKHGISLIIINKRIDFTGVGNVWFNTSWFLWNIVPNNNIYFEEI